MTIQDEIEQDKREALRARREALAARILPGLLGVSGIAAVASSEELVIAAFDYADDMIDYQKDEAAFRARAKAREAEGRATPITGARHSAPR